MEKEGGETGSGSNGSNDGKAINDCKEEYQRLHQCYREHGPEGSVCRQFKKLLEECYKQCNKKKQ